MAETSKNKIYYNDNEDSIADVLEDMKKLAESTDNAIEKAKYNDTELKNKDTAQDKLIEELQTKVVNLEAENTSLKNQIPSGEEVGNPIHLTDSSDLECEIAVVGNSEQETRSGSNILNFNVAQDSRVTVNDDGTFTINGAGGFGLKISPITLKSGVTYYEKVQLVSGTITSDEGLSIKDAFMGFNSSSWIPSASFLSYTPSEDVSKSSIWINAGVTFENAVIKLWANTDQSDFEQYGASPSPDYPSEIVTVGQNGSVEIKVDNGLETTDTNYQSYTKVLPIQKEFVKIGNVEDTFVKVDGKWYERHNIAKKVFDGTETWFYTKSSTGFNRFSTIINNAKPLSALISNIAKNVPTNPQYGDAFINENKYFYIYKDLTDVNVWKTYLSEQYANGTPAIIYYESATPELLECTAEQSAILNSFYTYKGITNISVDGIGTLKVNYKKDLETIINKLLATSVAE